MTSRMTWLLQRCCTTSERQTHGFRLCFAVASDAARKERRIFSQSLLCLRMTSMLSEPRSGRRHIHKVRVTKVIRLRLRSGTTNCSTKQRIGSWSCICLRPITGVDGRFFQRCKMRASENWSSNSLVFMCDLPEPMTWRNSIKDGQSDSGSPNRKYGYIGVSTYLEALVRFAHHRQSERGE